MAQNFRAGESGLYTLGGGTLLVSEVDSTLTGGYKGFVSVGNMPNFTTTLDPEFLEHYTSQSGKRVKDEEVVSQINASITAEVDEFSAENIRAFFYGGDVSSYAAQTATTATATGVIGTTRDLYLEQKGAASIVVKSPGGTTTYSLTTDYTVEDVFELKAIRWVSGGSITDGGEVLVEYTYTEDGGQKFEVLSNTQKEGKARLIGRSDAGTNWRWDIPSVKVNASGDFGLTGDDWSSFSIEIAVLEDSTGGFGTFQIPDNKWNT